MKLKEEQTIVDLQCLMCRGAKKTDQPGQQPQKTQTKVTQHKVDTTSIGLELGQAQWNPTNPIIPCSHVCLLEF